MTLQLSVILKYLGDLGGWGGLGGHFGPQAMRGRFGEGLGKVRHPIN